MAVLLSVVELGGYPDFGPLYRELGYQPVVVQAGRKAQAAVRQWRPAAVVAEFNLQRDFRDRTSSLESLLAMLQGGEPLPVVVLYRPEEQEALEQLRRRFPFIRPLALPANAAALAQSLSGNPD